MEVDYPILQARLNALRNATGERPTDFARDLHLIETGGQQLEAATLEIILQEKGLPVSLNDLVPREPSGRTVIEALQRHVSASKDRCALAKCTLLCRHDAMTGGVCRGDSLG